MHRFLNPCLVVPVLSWVALCPSRPPAVQAAEAKALNAGPDFVPGYLDRMTSWLARRVGLGA